MDDRFNTIAGWVLFAGIVALGSSIVAGEAFHAERPEKMGYAIEGVVEELYDVVALPGVLRPMAIGFRADEIRFLVRPAPSRGP